MSTVFAKEFAAVQSPRRKPPPNKDFSKRFVSALEGAGVSQGQLAKKLGIDKTTVWRWAEGTTQPMASLWPLIAEELKLEDELGIDLRTISLILGHVPRDVPESTRAYALGQRLADRRTALQAWADWLKTL